MRKTGMNFWEKLKTIFLPPVPAQKPNIQTKKLYCSLDKTIAYLQSAYDGSVDFTVRNITLRDGEKAALFTIEGMANKETLALSIANPVVQAYIPPGSGAEKLKYIERSVLSASEITQIDTFEQLLTFIMSGFAVLAIDGCDKALSIGVQGFSFRSVSEPESEVVQRGSREGFVEPLRINMTLIRRRMKTPELKFETMSVGTVSKTDICLCYLNTIVSKGILSELKRRLKETDLDTVLASGYLVPYLENKGDFSLFTGVGITERPDTVCGKINEGRIAILIDGTPSVLIVPHLFLENFQTLDDYSNRAYFATFTRWLKYIAFFVAVFTPGFYVAVATFNPELFPQQLLSKVAASIADTPFSLMTEVLIIHFIYEIMREAGLRLPRPLGHAVSIVGALVIGETAVNAGMIGAPTLMVVALTAISSYVIPDLYPPVAILRILFIIAGGIGGVWGIVLLFCVVLVNICGKLSFGVPYVSPIAPFSLFGMRDVLIRAGWKTLSKKRNFIQDQKGSEQFKE